MRVNFVDWKKHYQTYKKEIDKAIFGCLERGDYIDRDNVKSFEREFADFVGVKHAIGVNSGTDAIYMSLWASGIGQGDEVITVSHTFIATIAAIAQVGAIPVLVDVKYDDYLIDVDKIEEAITEKTKAIIPVHYNGRMADMEKIIYIARRHKLVVIEDACQSLGVERGGKKTGSFGVTGCFSFYPSKVLGGAGDGGAITTDDDNIAEKIRLLRDHGRKTKTDTVCLGMNSRLDEIQAALLRVKLRHLPETMRRKQEVAERYNEGLSDVADFPKDVSHENYVIKVKNRNSLYHYLSDNEIETQIHEPIPNHKIPEVAKKIRFTDLSVTERLSDEVISLPLNPEITNEQVEYIIKVIRSFYDKNTVQNN